MLSSLTGEFVMPNETVARAERFFLHYVDNDVAERARFAQVALELGHHCELYESLNELAAHPPRMGFVLLRDTASIGGGIVEAVRRLEDIGIWLSVVAVGDEPDPTKIVEAIKAGALDYITTPIDAARLERSLARTSIEDKHVSSLRQRRAAARDKVKKLTNRETDVLELLAAGHGNKSIARELGISPRTVEIHRANMMTKLEASNAGMVVRIAMDAGPLIQFA